MDKKDETKIMQIVKTFYWILQVFMRLNGIDI